MTAIEANIAGGEVVGMRGKSLVNQLALIVINYVVPINLLRQAGWRKR